MSSKQKKELKNAAAFLPLFLAISFAFFLATRSLAIDKAVKNAVPLSQESKEFFYKEISRLHPESNQILRELPYEAPEAGFDLLAKAAILVDANTGSVLYQKNADTVVPPASMTKLFLMRSVLEMARQGKVSLNQTIELDPRSWACSAPPHSSLMFLGKGQIATLEDLLCGLSVASGNDAAAAIAFGLFGSMERFIDEANALVKSIGLKQTVIVESSGYSENNLTTPREMAAFCRVYIRDYPEALEKFHSIKNFTYPKERNLPQEQRGKTPQDFSRGIPQEIWTPFEFENTNKLLGVLPGCDGIKTGHIDESGYNLALTTSRAGERYISVTMLGPGSNLREGDEGRCRDGATLHEWAYNNFKSTDLNFLGQTEFIVPLYGSEKTFARLLAKSDEPITVPKNSRIAVKAEFPEYFFGKIDFGSELGALRIYDGERLLEKIALASQTESLAANNFLQRCDEIILRLKKGRIASKNSGRRQQRNFVPPNAFDQSQN